MSSAPALLLLGLAFTLMTEAPSAAAEASPALTCSVTRLPGGLVRYRLSQPPSSPQCGTCWEDQNKTVIARDSKFNPTVVENLTNLSISLKGCHDFLLYMLDCPGSHEDARCRVNCSELLPEDDVSPHTVNSTLNCVFPSWCPDLTTVFVLGGVAVCVVAVVFMSPFLHRSISKRRRRRAAETTSYTPAAPQIKAEIQMDELYIR